MTLKEEGKKGNRMLILLITICILLPWFRGARWRRQQHSTPVLLPGRSHGWRSLVGCSPWGHEESDTTEQLHFHFSLSCTGEGNGSPLQCSCLENPRDGVAQSRTQLKRLSSSSSSAARRGRTQFSSSLEGCLGRENTLDWSSTTSCNSQPVPDYSDVLPLFI